MVFGSLIPTSNQDKATVEAALVTAAIALLGALIGYFLKYYLDKKQAFSSENAQIKRDMYKGYLDELLAVSSLDMKNLSASEIAKIRAEFSKYAKRFYSTSVLFASPKVIRRYADFVRGSGGKQSNLSGYEVMLKSSRLYKAMRKDIGLSNWRLGKDGELLLRANINDYDTTIGPFASWHKRLARLLRIKSLE